VIIGAFIADAALAYKIDKGLHDLKIMAGMPDLEWSFYTSINFYLVLLKVILDANLPLVYERHFVHLLNQLIEGHDVCEVCGMPLKIAH
jgi:hypothetical protein